MKTTTFEKILPSTFSVICVAMVGCLLCRVTASPAPFPALAAIKATTEAPQVTLDLERVKSAALFGTQPLDLAVVTPQPVIEPVYEETTLALKLVGVFIESKKASVIIAENGNTGKRYALNDMLPGDAQLVGVKPYYVILKRHNKFESLHFEQARSDSESEQNLMQGAMIDPQPPIPLPSQFP